eukprot:CAMPEP_0196575094 /NCGR_PEP_ID=MMETSP1081-20130531/4658_1 /TAXON_ID=36882 /ORGANISM="Pyramimonas amylifera, Strain CCMP720" /LENGTH=34 /DNA_ID= /DNA_START= /DNA_END= /DNA_ORIENTATION=
MTDAFPRERRESPVFAELTEEASNASMMVAYNLL